MAKYEAFRFYSNGGWDLSDKNYMFSVIAGPNEVEYIIPVDKVGIYAGFDKERINLLLAGLSEEQIPTTPEGWALLAAENISENVALMPSHDSSNDYNLLYEDEKLFADSVGEAQERERLNG